MLLLTSTSDKLQVITGSAGAVKVHASHVDNASGTITPGRTNTASITTATTTDVVAAPAASHQINVKRLSVRNDHASVSNLCTVQHTDGTSVTPLWQGTLLAGEEVVMGDDGSWVTYTAAGLVKTPVDYRVFNAAVVSQGAGFAADTYVAGSFVVFAIAPKVGTRVRIKVSLSKTAAGTATPILTLRFGTAGTTADTARNTFTFNAGTAAADVGYFEIEGVFRTVGSSTSAVFVATGDCVHSLSATGLINTPSQVLEVVSAGFDSTVAGLGVGLSMNGGTSAAWTTTNVMAEISNPV